MKTGQSRLIGEKPNALERRRALQGGKIVFRWLPPVNVRNGVEIQDVPGSLVQSPSIASSTYEIAQFLKDAVNADRRLRTGRQDSLNLSTRDHGFTAQFGEFLRRPVDGPNQTDPSMSLILTVALQPGHRRLSLQQTYIDPHPHRLNNQNLPRLLETKALPHDHAISALELIEKKWSALRLMSETDRLEWSRPQDTLAPDFMDVQDDTVPIERPPAWRRFFNLVKP